MGVGRSWAGCAAAMSAALLLGGCSGGSGSDAGSSAATPSSSASEVVASSPAASTSETPSEPASSSATSSASASGTAAGAAGVPEAARQHTEDGAVAFAKYYVSLLNSTGLKPTTGVLPPLALSSCKTCANYEGNVRWLKKNELRNSANAATVEFSRSLSSAPTFTVETVVTQNAIDVVTDSGSPRKSYNLEEHLGLVFDLRWTAEGWRIATIKIHRNAV